ncbi:Alpha/Beta hydrolase protein [Chytriomyces sp. MP71]|nr:Alpha/Beta hydrolase protein [Chytriomyces sp. MP71]
MSGVHAIEKTTTTTVKSVESKRVDADKTVVSKTVTTTTATEVVDRRLPFGRFMSPIGADSFASAAVGLSAIVVDTASNTVLHTESRPAEGGRSALVDTLTGTDLHMQFSLRSSVHEYGGGAISLAHGIAVFSNAEDKRVYVSTNAGKDSPVPVTPLGPSLDTRYADFTVHPSGRYLVCVQEVHSADHGPVINNLVCIPINLGSFAADFDEPTVIAAGRDFYSCPRFNASGSHLAWIEWDLPAMPWTCSTLKVGAWYANQRVSFIVDIKTAGSLKEVGGDVSVSQARWANDTEVVFASDQTGYYNLYRYNIETTLTSPILATHYVGDFSSPDWVFGQQTFDFLPNGNIIAAHSNHDGTSSISVLNPVMQTKLTIHEGLEVHHLVTLGNRVFVIAGSATAPGALSEVVLNDATEAVLEVKVVRVSTEGLKGLDADKWISVAEAVEFPTEDGLTAFGFYYPPKNPNHKPPSDTDLPPLIVDCHGGPTAQSSPSLKLRIQFWTSRGFAYFDCNYGGSSGYGKAYRERLNGKWGIVDVDDACNAALHLAQTGRVDRTKMAVTGGSAGGFTTLAVAAFRPGVFAAGVSKYGICDLKSLAELTHKFESRYLDIVLGTTNLSDEAVQEIYRSRSPINFTHQITAPLLILQGSADRVVPQNQAELIVEAIKQRGGIVGYTLFEGEGHGWRKSENIKKAAEVELEFYLENLKI